MDRLELTIPSPTSKSYSQVPIDSPASMGSSVTRDTIGNATPSPTDAPRQPCIPAPSPARQKRWQVLPGRNKFLCDGRLMMSRSTGMFFLTIGLLFLVNGLFFALDCPYLVEKVSPAVPAVAAVLFIFVLANLGRAAFSDPGNELRVVELKVLIRLDRGRHGVKQDFMSPNANFWITFNISLTAGDP